MIAPWAAPFVGIPFKRGGRDLCGWDCYGCVYYIYREVFKIDLPTYPLEWTDRGDWPRLTDAVMEGLKEWHPVAVAGVGDLVVLRIARLPLHVGLVVETAPLTMLHAEAATDTAIERLDGPIWARRVEGVYRLRA